MSLPVRLRPAAEADIEATHEYYERVRHGLGDRFVTSVREVLERIELMPEIYGVVWQDARRAASQVQACHLLFGFGRSRGGAGGVARCKEFFSVAIARLAMTCRFADS